MDEEIKNKISLINQKLDEANTAHEAVKVDLEKKKKNIEDLQEKLKGFIDGQFTKMKTGQKDLKKETKETRKDLN